jgi:small subunit ribosomal protein S6
MRKYEIMFIVKPDLEEIAIKQVAQDMKSVLENNNAKVLELKEMGQRDLAYEINKYKTGYYFLFTIETEDLNATKEFDRLSLINENILRHLIVKVED